MFANPPREVDFGELTSFCGGKIIFGPHWGVFTAANFLIVIPGVLMVFYTAYNLALSLTVAFMMIFSLASLWKTATTDPGVIPKQPPPPPDPDVPSDRSKKEDVTLTLRDGTTKKITVDRKWCYTCHLLRPPRAAHCPFCDVCISRRDHHCPWTGTCIGERNYRYFFLFVNMTSILALSVIVGSCYGLNRRQHAQEKHKDQDTMDRFWAGAAETTYIEFILVIYGIIIILMVGGLMFYHWYLVIANFTTHEEIRVAQQPYSTDQSSPFDIGCCANIQEALCAGVPRSRLVRGHHHDAHDVGGASGRVAAVAAEESDDEQLFATEPTEPRAPPQPAHHQHGHGTPPPPPPPLVPEHTSTSDQHGVSPDRQQLVGNESYQSDDVALMMSDGAPADCHHQGGRSGAVEMHDV